MPGFSGGEQQLCIFHGAKMCGAALVVAFYIYFLLVLPGTQLCANNDNRFIAGGTYIDAPWDSLKMFFLRSMILSAPAGVSSPMSPVWNQPSSPST